MFILVNKTTYLFTSIRDSNNSRGYAKIVRGEGRSYGKSLPWGWYGYFWHQTLNLKHYSSCHHHTDCDDDGTGIGRTCLTFTSFFIIQWGLSFCFLPIEISKTKIPLLFDMIVVWFKPANQVLGSHNLEIWTFHNATTGFPVKCCLSNERRNSILMTHHYPDLGSASDWMNSKQIFSLSEALHGCPGIFQGIPRVFHGCYMVVPGLFQTLQTPHQEKWFAYWRCIKSTNSKSIAISHRI